MAETSYKDLLVYFNGDFVPWAEATIHIYSPAVKYGAGVFEGIRGYWSDADERMHLFRVADHLRRLEYSQKMMRFDRIFTADEFAAPLDELIRRNRFRESVHIRPTVYVDGTGESAAKGPVDSFIVAIPRGTPEHVHSGCRVQVSSWQRSSDLAMPSRVKANANYNNSRFAAIQAKVDDYDTALMLNARGQVSEGPGMCIFIVRGGMPTTPSITSNILESITRATLIDLLRDDLELACVEREIDRSELYDAEEAFFCGTLWEITPIIEFDGIPVGDGTIGPVTKKLQRAYFDLVMGIAPDPHGWRTTL